MSSNKKTIKINPELFKLSSSKKTNDKKKTSKKRGGSNSIIRPNKIKKKLLERIKEHSRVKGNNEPVKNDITTTGNTENKYVEEFYESMNYLSKLANEKNSTSPYKPRKQTRKKPPSLSNDNIHVDIELPDDLKEHHITPVESKTTITLNPPATTGINPPYGCLKGGQKPTYRTWNKSQKNYSSIVEPIVTMPPIKHDTTYISTNEERLAKLKETFKQKHSIIQKPLPIETPSISSIPMVIDTEKIDINENNDKKEPFINSGGDIKHEINANNVNSTETHIEDIPIILTPKRTKKTTTRKYRIGKDDKKGVVGILIKDRQTRKKILDAQRSIRRTHISEMKKYLNTHGLMRAGSVAPNDIIRKMYESSVMSGDIFNNDNEILAHNFSQEF